MASKFNLFTIIILILFTILSLNACYYDNEQELYDDLECLTQNMSYTNDIVPILNRHCQLCHSAAASNVLGAGINLEGHSNLKEYVNIGSFLGSIQHSSGYSPMPKGGGKISSCDIEKIQSWVNNGSQNN